MPAQKSFFFSVLTSPQRAVRVKTCTKETLLQLASKLMRKIPTSWAEKKNVVSFLLFSENEAFSSVAACSLTAYLTPYANLSTPR